MSIDNFRNEAEQLIGQRVRVHLLGVEEHYDGDLTVVGSDYLKVQPSRGAEVVVRVEAISALHKVSRPTATRIH